MPPPITNPPVASGSLLSGVLGAIPIAGSLLSGVSQMFTNAANRRWQQRMYDQQRSDALADWRMQNEYNSPMQQMLRLKEAGLNPNLVYGQGSVANNATGVRASAAPPGNAQSPDFGSSQGGLFYGIDMAIRNQQLLNLKTANAAMVSSINNKDADTANKVLGNQFGKHTYETRVSTAEAILKNLGIRSEIGASQVGLNLMNLDFGQQTFGDRAFRVHQDAINAQQLNTLRAAANARAESMNIADIKLKAAQVLSLFAQTAKTEQERQNLLSIATQIHQANQLQEIDLWMKRAGFNWNDPVILRQLRMSNYRTGW